MDTYEMVLISLILVVFLTGVLGNSLVVIAVTTTKSMQGGQIDGRRRGTVSSNRLQKEFAVLSLAASRTPMGKLAHRVLAWTDTTETSLGLDLLQAEAVRRLRVALQTPMAKQARHAIALTVIWVA